VDLAHAKTVEEAKKAVEAALRLGEYEDPAGMMNQPH
jgi:hypothetical protein